MSYTNSTLHCHWCGISLGNACRVTYLNGNLACCDLCLMKGGSNEVTVKPKTL